MLRSAGFALLLSALVTSVSHAAETSLRLESDSGNPLEQRQSYSYGAQDGTWEGGTNYGTVNTCFLGTPDFSVLRFYPVPGIPFQPGIYLDAVSTDYATSPYMTVYGSAQSCQGERGLFQIKQVNISPTG